MTHEEPLHPKAILANARRLAGSGIAIPRKCGGKARVLAYRAAAARGSAVEESRST